MKFDLLIVITIASSKDLNTCHVVPLSETTCTVYEKKNTTQLHENWDISLKI